MHLIMESQSSRRIQMLWFGNHICNQPYHHHNMDSALFLALSF
jgi:hypothetical protein